MSEWNRVSIAEKISIAGIIFGIWILHTYFYLEELIKLGYTIILVSVLIYYLYSRINRHKHGLI